MAKEADIYQHLWRPDEIGITKAAELIPPIRWVAVAGTKSGAVQGI